MADSGAGFGVDLYQLEQVAKNHLPTAGMVYGNAIGKIESAKTALGGMSAVPPEFHGDSGSVAQAYDQLHGAIGGVLESTRTSLDETATALHKAVTLYAENDRAAGDKLNKLIEDHGMPKPELTP
ncbi:WXG100 family type VII secretion target [Amycolatopsis cihanbeyliensis]|uniref:Excreted virulence factor EspC (Type VII ESX diderm) n=1 Tax=Amycolatopsis cihanbeyliensis TaxID=1128664 RepID=A0A542DNT7_AMYCI|nr:hypothetical protein [Amycolatopsis cihanbeyliensis]TQJ04763.1 hypothetical protein FB471_4572 [Amycolatopsis cihanbeyliensis]